MTAIDIRRLMPEKVSTGEQCGLRLGRGTVNYPCTLSRNHRETDEPCFAMEIAYSVTEWQQWKAAKVETVQTDFNVVTVPHENCRSNGTLHIFASNEDTWAKCDSCGMVLPVSSAAKVFPPPSVLPPLAPEKMAEVQAEVDQGVEIPDEHFPDLMATADEAAIGNKAAATFGTYSSTVQKTASFRAGLREVVSDSLSEQGVAAHVDDIVDAVVDYAAGWKPGW